MLTDAEAKLSAAYFAVYGTAMQEFLDSDTICDHLPIEISRWVHYLIHSGPFQYVDKELFIDKLISLGIYVQRIGPRGPVCSWDTVYNNIEGANLWAPV